MIPAYSRIAPAEHAIGKPVTQSLIDRLRRNPLAILGIDEDDEAPVFRLAPSSLRIGWNWAFNLSVNAKVNFDATTAEVSLVDSRDALSSIEFYDSGLTVTNASSSSSSATIFAIEPIFSVGIPTHIRFLIAGTGAGSPTIPVDDAWHELCIYATGGAQPSRLHAKARFQDFILYLQFRLTGDGGNPGLPTWFSTFTGQVFTRHFVANSAP